LDTRYFNIVFNITHARRPQKSKLKLQETAGGFRAVMRAAIPRSVVVQKIYAPPLFCAIAIDSQCIE